MIKKYCLGSKLKSHWKIQGSGLLIQGLAYDMQENDM